MEKVLPRKVDVRIISATNRKVDTDIATGAIREDFYYRIVGVRFNIPPLRERKEDISALFNTFIKKYAPGREITITEEAQKLLQDYDWPGNVREFETVVRRLLVFAKDNLIKQDYLPLEILDFRPKPATQPIQKN